MIDAKLLATALSVMMAMEDEMKPDDIDQVAWDKAIEIASSWEEHQSLIDQMAIDIGYAIMAAKAEERTACLNEISMIAGSTVSASAALHHAYSAIRNRGNENG